jgi:hypothetical protein
VYQKCVDGLKVVNVHCLCKRTHLCQCVLCLEHFILRKCDGASHEFLLCSYNPECVNIFGRNVCGYSWRFCGCGEDILLSKETFGIWITCICHVGTEIRLNVLLLMATRSEIYRNGITLSAEQWASGLYLPVHTGRDKPGTWTQFQQQYLYSSGIKWLFYPSFCTLWNFAFMGPSVKISKRFIHSVILSRYSFWKNYCSVVWVVFQLFLCSVARTVSFVICRVLSSICHAINQKRAY